MYLPKGIEAVNGGREHYQISTVTNCDSLLPLNMYRKEEIRVLQFSGV